jgi:hypothetical protein
MPLDTKIKLLKLQLFCRLYSNMYTREIMESIRNESNYIFVNNSFLNDIIEITNTRDSTLLNMYKDCSILIGSIKRDYKDLVNSAEINHIKYLLNNNAKDDLEIILLAF